RSLRDWSSDVCSSDLPFEIRGVPVELAGDRAQERVDGLVLRIRLHRKHARSGKSGVDDREQRLGVDGLRNEGRPKGGSQRLGFRSEERRVGKEGRYR